MKAWVFGDNIDTDVIVPGRYMKYSIEEIARHCFEPLSASFASSVRPGDFVVAGKNFGAGSSREQAPAALKQLGIAALIAESFAGLFYRNALNLGLPALICRDARRIRQGDELTVDYDSSTIRTAGAALAFEPIPAHLMEMVRAGGLLPHLEKRLKCRTTS